MKLISGLHPPAPGGVDGRRKTRSTGPLKIVGMAFQNPTLLPWRTALENVLLPLEIVEPLPPATSRERSEYAGKARSAAGVRRAAGLRATSFPGSSPAACSSAPRSAAR